MKKTVLFLTALCIPACACLAGVHGNVQGTAARKPASRNAMTPGPFRKDTTGYHNPVYENGIKSAEYQQRGAEDRRNPQSADPNAIPTKRVPEKKVLSPEPVK